MYQNKEHKKPVFKSHSRYNWTQDQYELLYKFVVTDKIYDWEILASKLGITSFEIKHFWQTFVYPMIKSNERIGGSLKWSNLQDDILRNYVKTHSQKWQQISEFLFARSPCSIEARWKRIMCRQPNYQRAEKQSSGISTQIISPSKQVISPYDYRKEVMIKNYTQLNINKLRDKQNNTVDN